MNAGTSQYSEAELKQFPPQNGKEAIGMLNYLEVKDW